jgi:AmiR/NasT family two-component response regulator
VEFSVLIVESDSARRSRLNSACSNSAKFRDITQFRSVDDTIDQITQLGSVDICFFSNKIQFEGFEKLTTLFRERRIDRGTAYVLVGTHKGNYLDAGFHALIEDPFSVEGLFEIVDIACSVREQFKRAQNDSRLNVLVNDLLAQVRLIGHLSTIGSFNGDHLEAFRSISENLNTLSDAEVERYLDLLAESFVNEPLPPELPPTFFYKGASKRVRQIIESRIYTLCV